MSNASSALYVVKADGDAYTPEPVTGDKGDINFPEHVRGWSDVLDCRHTPYHDKPVEELRAFARHVHKFYILVTDGHIGGGKG